MASILSVWASVMRPVEARRSTAAAARCYATGRVGQPPAAILTGTSECGLAASVRPIGFDQSSAMQYPRKLVVLKPAQLLRQLADRPVERSTADDVFGGRTRHDPPCQVSTSIPPKRREQLLVRPYTMEHLDRAGHELVDALEGRQHRVDSRRRGQPRLAPHAAERNLAHLPEDLGANNFDAFEDENGELMKFR